MAAFCIGSPIVERTGINKDKYSGIIAEKRQKFKKKYVTIRLQATKNPHEYGLMSHSGRRKKRNQTIRNILIIVCSVLAVAALVAGGIVLSRIRRNSAKPTSDASLSITQESSSDASLSTTQESSSDATTANVAKDASVASISNSSAKGNTARKKDVPEAQEARTKDTKAEEQAKAQEAARQAELEEMARQAKEREAERLAEEQAANNPDQPAQTEPTQEQAATNPPEPTQAQSLGFDDSVHNYYKGMPVDLSLQAEAVAQSIAQNIMSNTALATDLDRVNAAAQTVAQYCSSCQYVTDSANHYQSPVGVFVTGVYTCAGSTRALGRVLDYMGYGWQHVNENQYTHQWCVLTLDGQTGFADGMGGFAGYGQMYSGMTLPNGMTIYF